MMIAANFANKLKSGGSDLTATGSNIWLPQLLDASTHGNNPQFK